jgi:hypothetical protein
MGWLLENHSSSIVIRQIHLVSMPRVAHENKANGTMRRVGLAMYALPAKPCLNQLGYGTERIYAHMPMGADNIRRIISSLNSCNWNTRMLVRNFHLRVPCTLHTGLQWVVWLVGSFCCLGCMVGLVDLNRPLVSWLADGWVVAGLVCWSIGRSVGWCGCLDGLVGRPAASYVHISIRSSRYSMRNETRIITCAERDDWEVTIVVKVMSWLPVTVTAQPSPARRLVSWVRIPFKAWMSVYSVFVIGSGLATGWSPV